MPNDTVDTLYTGNAENMIVTITLRPSFGGQSTLFLVANGTDVAELKQIDEDSRTFKLESVKVLSVRFGTLDTGGLAPHSVDGDYTISMLLK